jgi:hypothetical protein
MDHLNRATDALIQNPYMVSALLALAYLCGHRGAAGLGALWYAVKVQAANIVATAKEYYDKSVAEADRLVKEAGEMLKRIADSLGLGSIFNPLIDGMTNAVRMAIAGGDGLVQMAFQFLQKYLLHILLAFVAYRYLR